MENSEYWLTRESLLRAAANYWIVSDPVGPADAVAVLGGDPGPRGVAAAEYYRKGLVHKILISGGHSLISSKPSLACRRLAVEMSVPENAIEVFGSLASNTYQEAVALREWVLRNRARKVIVPIELFGARRVRWIFNRQLACTGTQISVPALDTEEYSLSNWWESDVALRSFGKEVLKYAYYRIRHWHAKH